jgi:hypothetical protein
MVSFRNAHETYVGFEFGPVEIILSRKGKVRSFHIYFWRWGK